MDVITNLRIEETSTVPACTTGKPRLAPRQALNIVFRWPEKRHAHQGEVKMRASRMSA
jgi:hypothetical protein